MTAPFRSGASAKSRALLPDTQVSGGLSSNLPPYKIYLAHVNGSLLFCKIRELADQVLNTPAALVVYLCLAASMGGLKMKSVLILRNKIAARQALRWGRLSGLLVSALVLALVFGLALGVAPVRAAAPAFSGGTLSFTQPNYRGVIAGPPGTRLEVVGSNWLPYSTITLSLTLSSSGCGGVGVGSFPTDLNGQFTAGFLWPLQVNSIGTYHVCGTQANNGSALSSNTFSLLVSSPPTLTFSPSSLVAGETLTVTGSNWVPGPQTLNVVVVPCNTICDAAPVAQQTIVTAKDGTFSQQLTISAGTPTGQYYIQAANSPATLAVTPVGPVQVSGQAAPVGTPVPGVNPTTTATRTAQDSTGSSLSTPSPLSQASASLKNAVLAAGLGLVVLLVLIGALAFFIGRSRGPDLPARAKAGKEPEPAKAPPPAARQAPQRAAIQPGGPPERALAVQRSDQHRGQPAAQEAPSAADEELPTGQGDEDEYPWEEQVPPPAPEEPEPGKDSASTSGRLFNTSTRYVPPRRYQRRGPPGDN